MEVKLSDELKFKKTKRTILFIDGVEFDKPRHLGDLLSIGFVGLLILITIPIWIWFYLLGKLFVIVAKSKQVDDLHYLCPNCGSHIDKIDMGGGDLFKISCVCGWNDYIDHFDKVTEVKEKSRTTPRKRG
jgi:hypothetical protein